jgi:ferredoxin
MALLITDECISCGACLPECPNEAIFETRSDAESKGYHVGDYTRPVYGMCRSLR